MDFPAGNDTIDAMRFRTVGLRLRWAALAGACAVALPGSAQVAAPAGENAPKTIYIIPIRGMIEPALTYVIRRGVAEADRVKADAIFFAMDTPGGAVNATEEIIKVLTSVKVPTYTFVEGNAISAGAIIALATDRIYMAPGTKIGDAMPIMMSPMGGVQPLPDAEREKITSYVDSIIRSVAETKGHDKQLASAMVRPEVEYKIGDEVISPEGQLLTLTNVEAARLVGKEKRPLLSSGTFENLDALLRELNLFEAQRVELDVTGAEKLARWIAALAPLFLMAGLLGLYIEFKTPGFGLPGILGLLSLAIFFWGHHIAGLAGSEDLAIFLIGVVLILVEILFFPGMGLIGLAGAALIFWSLLSAMIQRMPGDPMLPSWPQIEIPLAKLTVSLALTGVAAALLGRFLPRSSLFQRLVLQEATRSDRGFRSGADESSLVGTEGVALTDLRPGGAAMFGDRKLDVVAAGLYVKKGQAVRVVDTHGNRIVVECISTS